MIKRIFLVFIFCFFFFSNSMQLFAADEVAVFAGGCFWCLEHDLESIPGVVNVESGYSGGDLINPTYRNHKGHKESVRVSFDSEKLSYKKLLRAYWRNVDPFNDQGQFCDNGDSYRPVIFTNDKFQNDEAMRSLDDAKQELNAQKDDIKVEILVKNKFWLAEDYHQDYAENNKIKYNFYRYSCGRDNRLKEVWGEKATLSEPWDLN